MPTKPTARPAVPSEEEVARAIAAEREACAKIAEHHGELVGEHCWNHENRRTGEIGAESSCWNDIAKAIRARNPPTCWSLPSIDPTASENLPSEEAIAGVIYENAFDCRWAETEGIERDLWLQVARAVLALLKGEKP